MFVQSLSECLSLKFYITANIDCQATVDGRFRVWRPRFFPRNPVLVAGLTHRWIASILNHAERGSAMALCPHCWESLAEPVPATCPKCHQSQPLHLDIPDAPPDDLASMDDEPHDAWTMEALLEAGPGPPAEGVPEPTIPSQPDPPPWAEPAREEKRRGATGLVVLVAGIIFVSAAAAVPFDVAPRDASGRVSATGRTIEDQLVVGDCYGADLELGEAFGGAVTTTPCSDAHLWEVVGRLTYPEDEYPGEAAMETWAVELCRRAYRQYVGAPEAESTGLEMWYRYPREANWDAGFRLTWCLATRGQNSTGSVRAGA